MKLCSSDNHYTTALDLEKFIENTSPESNVVTSNLITRTDNGRAFLPLIKTNEPLRGLQMITSNDLNKRWLHLNPRGLGKLAINFIRRIKKFATT